ncbi:glycosyltransferase [Candidatus Margulisiibacteriota bacterium]
MTLNWHYISQILILIYFIAINGSYTLLIFLAFFEVRHQYNHSFIEDYPDLYKSKLAPGLSYLVPAYNEEATIAESAKSYLKTKYSKYEVIVINDGSTDNTLQVLKDEFKLKKVYRAMNTRVKTKKVKGFYISQTNPNLFVIDKYNGGSKADALNAGINAARHPYFICVDADVIMDKSAMLRIMRPMLEDPAHNMAAGGIVRIVNDSIVEDGQIKEVKLSKNPIVAFQVVEYIRAFTAGRAGFQRLKTLLIVSGAFGVFNTEVVRKIGGYQRKTLGEDMELLVRLHRHLRETIGSKYNIIYRTYPVCWTEAPETLKVLGSQRNRWHRGLSDVLLRHKKMIFNPRYGRIGMFGMPFFLFIEFLGPIIEFFGYFYVIYMILFGVMQWEFFFLFLALAMLWGIWMTVTAILFEDLNFKWYKHWYQIAALIFFALVESFGYRQLTLIWRIQGLFDYLRGQHTWTATQRKGFKTSNT